jgi:pSer/pThr/pTyr-binding forkhead associated (FHA) protein
MGDLVVRAGDQTDVFRVPFTVGRSDTAGITLDDEYVSPRHALFWPADGIWFVEDAGSTNGTWLNGQKIYGPHRVSKGDEIRIGHTVLTAVPTWDQD